MPLLSAEQVALAGLQRDHLFLDGGAGDQPVDEDRPRQVVNFKW